MGMEMVDAIVRAKQIKESLNGKIQGKFMIRQDKSYKGNQLFKIWDFNVYYAVPIPANRQAIQAALQKFGAKYGKVRVQGGAYGYVIHFSLGED